MSILQSILLGILQGIAEFLPISSSGHLILAQKLFNLESVPLLYDVFLHLATLGAVCIFFRKTISALFGVLIRWIFKRPCDSEISCDAISPVLCGNDENGRRTILVMILGCFITVCLGLVTEKFLDDMPLKVIFCGFIFTSLLLVSSSIIEKKNSKCESEYNSEQCKKLSFAQGALIGLFQGIGTLPGVSRSGSTIAGALFGKVDRRTAGDFSFLISIPVIFGAFLLELKDIGEIKESIGLIQVIAGCIAAFVSGYLSLAFLMKLIRKGKIYLFTFYLVPVAILGLIFLA